MSSDQIKNLGRKKDDKVKKEHSRTNWTSTNSTGRGRDRKENLTIQKPGSVREQFESTEAGTIISDRPRQLPFGSSDIAGGGHQFTINADSPKPTKFERSLITAEKRLGRERWTERRGHTFTYAGVFLFTFVLYFRPYELISMLSGFDSMAFYIAIGTLLIYLPAQLSAEGKLTSTPTEVKCVVTLILFALLSIVISQDASRAWLEFKDFAKAIIIFVIMVNVLRTWRRLYGLLWLAIGSGVMLSYEALRLYRQGEFNTDGYRVNVELGGMFGNPNDMAIHLGMFMPIAVAMGIGSSGRVLKLIYYASAIIMTGGILVTQSRGGFIGLAGGFAVLIWKFGRNNRLQAVLLAMFAGIVVMIFAPGDYGLRLLSIFVPSLDPVGSANARTDLLIQSVWVSLRNPFGIGIGNFPIVGIQNKVPHNAYTQVSAELGMIALAVYLILLISPLRKLAAIERRNLAGQVRSWVYPLTIGLQASIASYMCSSFFASVAYNWYVYYPIAFAICLRRLYLLEDTVEREPVDEGPRFPKV